MVNMSYPGRFNPKKHTKTQSVAPTTETNPFPHFGHAYPMHQYELNSWSKMNIDQIIQSQQLQLISEDLRNFHFPRPTCTASDQQRPCSSTPSMTMMHLRWNLGIWGGNMVGLMIVLTIFMNEKSHVNIYVLRFFHS